MRYILSIYLLRQFCCLKLFKRTNSVLVIAQHNNEILHPVTQETVTAARRIGGKLAVLVAGQKCSEIAKLISSVKGLHKVLISEDFAFNGFLAENLTPLILTVQKQFGFTHIMAGATVFGKTILPRVAGKLNVSAITDVIDIKDQDTFVRPTYGGNVLMTLKMKDPVKIITIKPKYFEPCVVHAPIVEAPEGKYNANLSLLLKQNFVPATKTTLEEAKIVICGGKGLKSAKNFKMLYNLAQHINAAVGASKAAVDAGIAPRDIQIPQNGRIAPNLYIAVGVSGTAQHVAAIKNSETIVAINADSKAPIFNFAHYGLIADLFEVLPELHNKLKPQVQINKSYLNYIETPHLNII